MPKLAETNNALVSYESNRSIYKPDAERMFLENSLTVSRLLTTAGFLLGHFKMWTIKKENGSPHKQRRAIFSMNCVNKHEIHLVMQPGDNGTAWRFRLHIPEHYTSEEVKEGLEKAMEAEHTTAQRQDLPKPERADVVEVPASVENNVIALGETRSSISAEEMLKDLDIAAIAIQSAFIHVDAVAEVDDLIAALREELDWGLARSQQAVNGLIARKCLEKVPSEDGDRVRAIGQDLRWRLIEAGVEVRPHVQPPTDDEPFSTPPTAKEILRDEARVAIETGRIQRVPPGDPKKKSPSATQSRLAAQFPPPKQQEIRREPSVEHVTGAANRLAELERKAAQFLAAQQTSKGLMAQSKALEEERDTLVIQLAEVNRRLEDVLAAGKGALEILSDPSYSSASERLSKINALMAE